MRRFALVAALMLLCGGALAQDAPKGPPPQERPGPTTSADVLSQNIIPAPENGNIVVKFNDTVRVYFKRPIKSVRLEDGMLVSAEPKSDHVIAFTGLSPGKSSVTIEAKDGSNDVFGVVTVVREPHDVRVYQQEQVNRVTGERRWDSSSAIGGYVVLSCNELGCTEKEPELQPKWPTGRP
jgi:hypothetical protein